MKKKILDRDWLAPRPHAPPSSLIKKLTYEKGKVRRREPNKISTIKLLKYVVFSSSTPMPLL